MGSEIDHPSENVPAAKKQEGTWLSAYEDFCTPTWSASGALKTIAAGGMFIACSPLLVRELLKSPTEEVKAKATEK